jgi:hypothetical protein
MTKLIASLLIGVAGLTGAATHSRRIEPPAPPPAEPRPVPRILCERPRTLHLRRFEDRSAQLLCSGRILARISVPG